MPAGRPRPRVAPSPALRARAQAVRRRLLAYYGLPTMAPHGEPLGELVLTLLSQSTNDRNRDRAFLSLLQRFPSWEAALAAPEEELEEALRPGGIARVKARRLKAILAAVAAACAERGEGLSLAWLGGESRERALAFLCGLPGIGPKTAACVLLFSFGWREVPVDTHLARVGRRLGFLPEGASSEFAHRRFLALTPPGAELEFHVNLLRHGRRLCKAREPRCGSCPLWDLCPTGRSRLRGLRPGSSRRSGRDGSPPPSAGAAAGD